VAQKRKLAVILLSLLFIVLVIYTNSFGLREKIFSVSISFWDKIVASTSNIIQEIKQVLESLPGAIFSSKKLAPISPALLAEAVAAIVAIGTIASIIKLKLGQNSSNRTKIPKKVSSHKPKPMSSQTIKSMSEEASTMKDIPIKPSQGIGISKIPMLFVILSSFMLGIAPAILIINRADAMTYFTIVGLFIVTIVLHGFKSVATEKPSVSEYFVGWVSVILWGALTGIILLLVYGAFLGGTSLAVIISNWLGYSLQINGALIASWASIIIAFIPGMFLIGVGANSLPESLYPNKAHIKSSFYELVTAGKRKLSFYLLFFSSIFALLFFWVVLSTGSVTAWWFNVLFLGFLSFGSLMLQGMEKDIDSNLPKIIEASSKLFKSLGYKVVLNPTTGQEEFDPLLVGLDLFVINNEHALAAVIHTDKLEPNGQWTTSSLLRSVRTLNYYLQEQKQFIPTVAPLIIVLGKKKTEWAEEEISIVEIPDQKFVDKVLSIENEEELKKIALDIFDKPVGVSKLTKPKETIGKEENKIGL
jgi:hypothetical protein